LNKEGEVMEEKFYYTRKFIKQNIISIMLGGVIAPLLASHNLLEGGSIWFGIGIIALLLVATSILMILRFLKAIDNPVIVITDKKIIVRPLYFGKQEVSFEQILPTAIIDDKIRIKYKKLNNKESSFSIAYLRRIDNYERLIEVLKQHIKFV
jgi:hypothetical protein